MHLAPQFEMTKFSREEAEQLSKTVIDREADDPDGFFARLGRQVDDNIPTVTVEWKDLQVVTEGKTSAASLPSVPNVFLNFAKVRPSACELNVRHLMHCAAIQGCAWIALQFAGCLYTCVYSVWFVNALIIIQSSIALDNSN